MNLLMFSASCLLSAYAVSAFDERLLKHLTEPKPGGLLGGILKKPKLPTINIHLSKGNGEGFGAGASIGSFGFGFGFGGQYVPPGKGVNLPPNKPQVPDRESDYVPDLRPDLPDSTHLIPNPEPYLPEKGKKETHPDWKEYEEDDPKRDSYGKGEDEYPNRDSYGKGEDEYPNRDSFEETKDAPPSWEDIGEKDQSDSDSKSENFMNGELVNEGLINPRRKNKRNKRFVESHVYHVPLMFRSNAKPFQVKVQSNPNSLIKNILEK